MRGRFTYDEPGVVPITPVVFRIVLLVTVALLLQNLVALLGMALPGYFGSGAPMRLFFDHNFHPVQIVTHIFYIYPGIYGIFHLLFQVLILWSFGSELERLWGSYNFLKFFLLGLLGGVVLSLPVGLFLLPGLSIFGIGAGLSAILIAYAMIWPDRQALFFMVVPIKMKWLIPILLLLMAISDMGLLVLHSGGALAGALFLFYYARKGRIESGYIIARSYGNKSLSIGLKERVNRYFHKRKMAKKQAVINHRIEIKAEVDRLLGKISKEGINSLTKKERAFLDRASSEF